MNPKTIKQRRRPKQRQCHICDFQRTIFRKLEYIKDGNIQSDYSAMQTEISEIVGIQNEMLAGAEQFHFDLDTFNSTANASKVFNVIGCKKLTTTIIDEHEGDHITFLKGDGDGRVPVKSGLFVDANRRYAALGASHGSLPSHNGVKLLIRSLLQGYESDFTLSLFDPVVEYCESCCGISGLRIFIPPPPPIPKIGGAWVWPKIRTGDGGIIWRTGNGVFTNIIGSDYIVTNEGIEIFVPEGNVYTLDIEGVDKDYIDWKFQLMSDGGVIRTYVYTDITLDMGSCGQVTFDLANALIDPVLRIDNLCDGNFEQENIPPTYILDEAESDDTIPPVTESDINGTLGAGGWYTSSVTVTLNATDIGGSGLLATRYQFANDALFTAYSTPILITEPGEHIISYYSIDRNLNKETIKTVTIKIDDGAPPQIISVLPPDQAYDVVPNSSFQIGFNEEMDTTLIDSTTMMVNGSILGGYAGQYSFDTGTNTLSFTPNLDYLLGEEISVNISGNLTDLAGIGLDGNANGLSEGSPLDDFFWSFFITETAGLNVQITDVDISNCPSVKATLIVTDDTGTTVPDLTETHFTVYDNNYLENDFTVEFVDQSASPISVSLALDYSGSMSDTANSDMESAAVEFVSAMGASDEGQVVKFANGVEVAQVYTTDKTMLTNAITTSTSLSNSATHLYDALYQAITDTAVRSGRKAVIAMTDGADNGSTHTDLDVINYSNANGVPLFTIGLGDNINGSVLQAIADQTGGVYYEAPTSDDLQAIYQAISDVLKNQYIITFTPDTFDSQEHILYIIAADGSLSGSDTVNFLSCGSCPADLDNDADSDGLDLFDFTNAYMSQSVNADLNGDGYVTDQDLTIFVSGFGQSDCR